MARSNGFHKPLSHCDDSNPYTILYDYAGAEEHIRWIVEDWLKPSILYPILSRLDDVMDNIIHSFGDKEFSAYYKKYWQRRQEEQKEEQRKIEERYGKIEKENQKDKKREHDNLTGTIEMAGKVSFTNLDRVVKMTSNILGDLESEHKSETSLFNDLQKIQSDFEKNPEEFFKSPQSQEQKSLAQIRLETHQQFEQRMQQNQEYQDRADQIIQGLPSLENFKNFSTSNDVKESQVSGETLSDSQSKTVLETKSDGNSNDISDYAEILLKSLEKEDGDVHIPLQVEKSQEEANLTVYGDKKLSADDAISEDQFEKWRIEKLQELADQNSPYIYNSTQEAAFAAMEHYIYEQGFESYDEFIKHQNEENKKERLKNINSSKDTPFGNFGNY